MAEHEVSHGDILRAIGNLEGKLDSIATNLKTNRDDIAEAFRRLGQAEQRIAQGVIIAVVISLVMPVVVAMVAPRIEFGPHSPDHHVTTPRG